ncbi:MAG TPA: Crp/Fnr family transcriptional regulator [Acidobacteriota bacterium]|nr:Crp/Fnr family transcriptional regulator [Acidobacteriota bacterium]
MTEYALCQGAQEVIEHTGQLDQFKLQIKELFRKESFICRTIKVPKHDHVYTCGENDPMVYFIERGQVKVLLLSAEGKECLLAILTAGDIFGELSLFGQCVRVDTAVAMQDVVLKQIPSRSFMNLLKRESMLEGLVQYLVARVAEQQEVITSLLTANSEQRLGMTLLHLARRLGKNDPRSVRIEQKISHEELAEMVGTTRPRIGIFLKRFRELGLVELSRERHFVIREGKLKEYLAKLAFPEDESLEMQKPRQQETVEPAFPTLGIS